MIHIYGIKNCNTVKKALDWASAQKFDFQFHDFKKEIPTEKLLKSWIKEIGLNVLVNRQGTTYKQLSEAEKAACEKITTALPLLMEKPSMIKRPVWVKEDGSTKVGFNEEEIADWFS
jgi:Spx/MgsR family transcriptional regulator